MPRHTQQQERLVFHYQSAAVRALNNGHTIQVNVPPRSKRHLNGRASRLGQFHFRYLSEHHVDGRTYQMEIYFVHQDARGPLVVITALGEVGPENKALANL